MVPIPRLSEAKPMKEDAFISGLRAMFASDPSLKPSVISREAGLDISTIRKMLDGQSTNPTRRSMEAIAARLGTTAEAIAMIAAPHPVRKSVNTGLGEDQAAPFQGKLLGTPLELMLRQAGIGAVAYQISRPAASLGLLAGDILVVNLSAPPKSGDIILVGHSDEKFLQTLTLIRRYFPPFAVSCDAGDTSPVLTIDETGHTVWRGTVTSMIRPQIKDPTYE